MRRDKPGDCSTKKQRDTKKQQDGVVWGSLKVSFRFMLFILILLLALIYDRIYG